MNSQSTTEIQRIHLIFKTHLDVGFTDFAAKVVHNYFTSYIPRAIELARGLREKGSTERFVWTTGSWLIFEYLEQAGKKERKRMEEAINSGDITWHALPFTTHSENMDASLFQYGLSLSQKLDQRFGRKTISAKMTDVPGHTRGIVPLLAEAGVIFLHIGVNGASTPPDVPPVFTWQDPGGESIMVMYHKGSYGELMVVPGCADAIAFAHTGDNLGPQSTEDLQQTYREIRGQFPRCNVQASTMDDFAMQLMKVKDNLPVIEQEIGDTWIHGAGTDPKKEAQYRELSRLRREWLAKGISEEKRNAFSRKILVVPEHTWGLDVKTHLGDWEHYSAKDFGAVRGQTNFHKMELSWQEQRGYLKEAVDALPEDKKLEAEERLAALNPVRSDQKNYEPLKDLTRPVSLGMFSAIIDAQAGWLRRLEIDGKLLTGPENTLGKFWYETFSAADYQRFHHQYNVNKHETWFWAIPDFTKPGIEEAAKEHRIFIPHLTWAGKRDDQSSDSLLLLLEMPKGSWEEYGAPKSVQIEINASKREAEIDYRLQWFEKPACRLPEAIWFSFIPRVSQPHSWKMNKLGQWISPYEVIRGGNRHLHGVGDGGVRYDDSDWRINITSADTALVAPGQPSLLDFNNRQPNLSKGIHFNLYNNLWGTNFPMWYEEDAVFRFSFKVKSK